MRTGRNGGEVVGKLAPSLDHWDMRTGRNLIDNTIDMQSSLDHWDMRTGLAEWRGI